MSESGDFTTFPVPYFIVADLPDLGAVTDACSFVGEHAGTGRFAATAFKSYLLAATDTRYLPLTGGVLSGPLTVGGNGTTWPIAGGTPHAIGFGWDGSHLVPYVDGTSHGTLATQADITSAVAAYLPLSGGTETGLVTFNGSPTSISAAHDVSVGGNLSVSGAANISATT